MYRCLPKDWGGFQSKEVTDTELSDGRNHCIRAQKDRETGALTFVHPKFSYQVTVIKGKQLSQ